MDVGGALRELGRYLDECEQHRAVTDVRLAGDCNPGATGRVTAAVDLRLSPCPASEGSWDATLAGAGVDDGGRLVVPLETAEAVVPEPTAAVDLDPRSVTIDDEGTMSVTLAASTSVGSGAPAADATPSDDAARADDAATGDEPATGGGAATGDESATTDGSSPVAPEDCAGHRTSPSQPAPARAGGDADGSDGPPGDRDVEGVHSDRDVPPFRDPELLRDVYESCDTFAEMPEALGMDVTAETVRRYMIDYGIHEPSSYDTSGEAGTAADVETPDDPDTDAESADAGRPDAESADAGRPDAESADAGRPDAESSDVDADLESPVVIADGIGLPDDLTVDALVDVVRRSNTIYEVKTEIGIERDEALEMLHQLDLVDHVVGRLATKDERELSRELVVEHLREHAEAR